MGDKVGDAGCRRTKRGKKVLKRAKGIRRQPHQGLMETLERILAHIPWFAWVGIVAIICGTITTGLRMSNTHAERMEKIRLGMDPGKEE